MRSSIETERCWQDLLVNIIRCKISCVIKALDF
jgi:hypothetical protein